MRWKPEKPDWLIKQIDDCTRHIWKFAFKPTLLACKCKVWLESYVIGQRRATTVGSDWVVISNACEYCYHNPKPKPEPPADGLEKILEKL